jgi:hypothetical protein
MPCPPWSQPGWFQAVFSGLMRTEVGIGLPDWLVAALVVIGLLALLKEHSPVAIALISIIFFVLGTSGLRLYPAGGRLSLFLAPLFMLLVGKSLEAISRAIPGKYWIGNAAAGLVGISLLFAPMGNSLEDFTSPKYYEHIRPAMATLAENWREGNVLYVSFGAFPAYRYYANRYGLEGIDYVTDPAPDYQNPETMLAVFTPLVGRPRVWILMTHIYERVDFNEKDFVLSYLNSIGEKRREFRYPGTSVYLFLYDLNT